MQKLIKLARDNGTRAVELVEQNWIRLEKGLDAAVLNEHVAAAASEACGVLIHWHDAHVGHLSESTLRAELGLNDSNFGIWLDGEDDVAQLGEDCQHYNLVALDFPRFVDGRSYSSAYLLRKRYEFTGELRAIGDVLVDQVFYMQRCGFDAFALRADKSIEAAIDALNTFSVRYQTSVDNDKPLFKTTDRPRAA